MVRVERCCWDLIHLSWKCTSEIDQIFRWDESQQIIKFLVIYAQIYFVLKWGFCWLHFWLWVNSKFFLYYLSKEGAVSWGLANVGSWGLANDPCQIWRFLLLLRSYSKFCIINCQMIISKSKIHFTMLFVSNFNRIIIFFTSLLPISLLRR